MAQINLDNYHDVVVRDLTYRHQSQTAQSGNIIRRYYSHTSGNTANLSVAEVVSVGSGNVGQLDFLISTTTARLSANSITAANTASWSANSIFSIRSANTTIRSANVIVSGNLFVNGAIRSNTNNVVVTGNVVVAGNLILNGAISSNVGIRKIAPAFELDVAGTTRSDAIRTRAVTALGPGLFIEPGQTLANTVLTQGTTLAWNSDSGAGRTDIINKSGTGAGGIQFWNSGGSGSAFSVDRTMMAQMLPDMMVVPVDLQCANSVGTTTSTGGFRFYYRQLSQPCIWTTSVVVTPTNSAGFSIDVVLTDPPFCQSSDTTMVSACNGDPVANVEFIVLGAYLFNLSGTFPNNSQPQRVRLWCRCTNTSSARANIQILFYPI